MKTIYFAGDSHTSGTMDVLNIELKECPYSTHLANLLGYKIIGNTARGGAGNDRILNHVKELIWECKRGKPWPDFIVVAFSEPTRFEWFINGETQTVGLARNDEDWQMLYDYTEETFAQTHGPGLTWTEATEKWPERSKYTSDYLADSLRVEGIRHHQHNQMFNLHCELMYNRIPHLFFNAHVGFDDRIAEEKRNCNFKLLGSIPLIEFGWSNRFWNVYEREDSSFVSWAQARGYELTPGYHVPNQGAIEFAHVLHDYIVEHGLLEI